MRMRDMNKRQREVYLLGISYCLLVLNDNFNSLHFMPSLIIFISSTDTEYRIHAPAKTLLPLL